MRITLRTLTPLWTGGVERTTDCLHETGLIGSLRWWYEAMVRGLGGKACDPTKHSCTFDQEKYHKSKTRNKRERLLESGVCDACQLFGCTGWAREFRVRVTDGQSLFTDGNILIPSGRVHQSRQGPRAGGWFILSDSRVGEIQVDLIPLRDADLRPIHTILALIGRHASLGPKGASGYGVIRVENGATDLGWIQKFTGQPPRNHELPDFRDFFFGRFQFQEPSNNQWWQTIQGIKQAVNGRLDDGSSPKPLRKAQKELEQIKQQGILPIAPAIRNFLRYQWQHNLPAAEAHSVFGEAQAVCPNCYQPGFKTDRRNPSKNWCSHCKSSFDKGKEIPATASKIYVSYAYHLGNGQWEFRIWGWLPCKGAIKKRDTFLDSLKDMLQSKDIWDFVFGNTGIRPELSEWHSRACQDTDGQAYLQELLGGAP